MKKIHQKRALTKLKFRMVSRERIEITIGKKYV